MNFDLLKKDTKYLWTQHVIRKMAFYGLSPDRVRRIIRNPKRVEEGIAENTVAVMQSGTNLKKPSEVWVMYQQTRNKKQGTRNKQESEEASSLSRKVIISAWRYPGVSPVGKQIPIPQAILEELKRERVIS